MDKAKKYSSLGKKMTFVKDRKSGLRLYRRIINAYIRGAIERQMALDVANMLNGYLLREKDFKLDEIENKIAELEKEMREV